VLPTYKVLVHSGRLTLVVAMLTLLLPVLGFHRHTDSAVLAHEVELLLTILSLLASIGLMGWAYHVNRYSLLRGIVTLAFDCGLVTLAMIVLEPHGVWLYVLYPVLLAGYGASFGRKVIPPFCGVASACFVLALIVLPSWQRQPGLWGGLLLLFWFQAWMIYRRSVDDTQRRQALRGVRRAHNDTLSHVSSQLRGPLNGLIGTAALLSRSQLTPDQRSHMRAINASARHMLRSIEDMLDLASLSSGKVKASSSLFDLRGLLSDIVDGLTPSNNSGFRGVVTEVAEDIPDLIIGDSGSLEQILVKLLEGALSSAGATPLTLRVSVAFSDSEQINVRFDVLGYPTVAQDQQDDSDLSWMVVRGFVDVLGGSIETVVRSSAGPGYAVTLPMQRRLAEPADDDVSENVIHMARTTAAHHVVAKPLRILIADDDGSSRVLLRRLLERVGHDVTSAHHGNDVLRELDSNAFDALIIDLHMPGLSGIDLLKFLRERAGANSSVPIIVVSADTSPMSVARVQAAGASAFVAKPITTSRLLDVVANISQSMTGRDAPAGPIQLSVDTAGVADLVLDHGPIDAMASLGMDDGQGAAFIDQCLLDADGLLRAIYIAGAQAQWETLRGCAHQLAGIVGNIGLRRVANLARQMHKLSEAECMEDWEWRANDLKTELAQGRVALRRLRDGSTRSGSG
jgi:two-component system sensor histidine kinase RpfC